jgi:hypothetical protein
VIVGSPQSVEEKISAAVRIWTVERWDPIWFPAGPWTPFWSGEVLGSGCAVSDGLTAGTDLPPGSPGTPAPLFRWAPRGGCPVISWLVAWANAAGAASITAVAAKSTIFRMASSAGRFLSDAKFLARQIPWATGAARGRSRAGGCAHAITDTR